MSYQIFLLFEKENEIPVFLGQKLEEDQIVLSRYEKLDVFFGKSLDFLIIEKDIPDETLANKIEEFIYNSLMVKFPDLKILRYKDFLNQQKHNFLLATELISALNKSVIEGDTEAKKLHDEEIKKLLSSYKRSFKRRFTFDQIKTLREKFSGPGNNFFGRKHSPETKKKLGRHLKRKKKLYDKARKKTWKKINAKRKGKTWEEIYGEEKAREIKEKAAATRKENKLKKDSESNPT